MAYVTSGYACKGTLTMVVNGTIISNMAKIEFGDADARRLDDVRSKPTQMHKEVSFNRVPTLLFCYIVSRM